MDKKAAFPILGLRTKLILSYLAIALGTVLIFTVITVFAVQQYLDNWQVERLETQATYRAQSFLYIYKKAGNSWGDNGLTNIVSSEIGLIILADKNGQPLICSQPRSSLPLEGINCNDATVLGALKQAVAGKEVTGYLKIIAGKRSFDSLYVSIPLRTDGGEIVGAMLLTEPQDFALLSEILREEIKRAILIVVLITALIALVVAILLAHNLTRPLKSLTLAAEQMKLGHYTQRVPQPQTLDDLGRLALTFNEMANTIEADVTELRRQEQVRRDLLANITHDLATPLTAIQGFSEALADDIINDPAARQETAQRIGREVQRLRRLVADIQQMTSLELGRTTLDLAPLNMHTLVDETVAVIAGECAASGINLINDISSKMPLVQADSDRITQVLLNLLDNARRHTPSGGEIRIGAAHQEGEKHLQIWICDTGTGIETEDLPYIFERFYRADRSRTGATGGSGLGLSIVKAIIIAHNGTVKAESTPGKGTRITFTLPLA